MTAPQSNLNTQILLGALLGITLGWLLGHTHVFSSFSGAILQVLELIGRTFINLLKMVLVPLVFTSVTAGVAGLQKSGQGKRLWPVWLVYFLSTTALAAVTGLVAINIFKTGWGLDIQALRQSAASSSAFTQTMIPQDLGRTLLDSALLNPITAMANNNVLAIVIFSIFLGAALVQLGEKTATLLKVVNELFDVTMTVVGWIMRLAPLGIMGLLGSLVAKEDLGLLSSLGSYIALVLGTTLFHGVVTLPAILWFFTRISPLRFFLAMREAFLTAFSTSSSSATIPVTLRCVTENLKVDPSIARFVVPVGATLNMDGTVLYEAMAALFVANLCGIHLDLLQQGVVAFMAILASIGAPGIPSAGMVTMIMVLQSVGLPIEAVALLVPIDRPLDTLRTVVNVEGDCVGCCILQKMKA